MFNPVCNNKNHHALSLGMLDNQMHGMITSNVDEKGCKIEASDSRTVECQARSSHAVTAIQVDEENVGIENGAAVWRRQAVRARHRIDYVP